MCQARLCGSQTFQMAQPQWVKYVQLHFLSQYGAEAVCALNDVRIFGKSAADDLEDRLAMEHAQEDAARWAMVVLHRVCHTSFMWVY